MDHRQTVVCTLEGPADLCVLDALLRLQLVARRRQVRLQVVVRGELADLLAMTGLDVALQPVREAEAREQRFGVEEVVEVDDPAG